MTQSAPGSRSTPRRLALLWVLFFLICLGLGYPSLNRLNWRAGVSGLDDVRGYGAMVEKPFRARADLHTDFRILVPLLAKPIYRAALGHIGTWDPVMFSLLVVNAAFVAGTVLLLLNVMERLNWGRACSMGAALLYLVNFAVPNLRLSGMIDAGEGFAMMLLVKLLMEERYWALLPLGAIGALAKESFVPFLIVFSLAWWACSRTQLRSATRGAAKTSAAWMVCAWIAALASLTILHWRMSGVYESPLRFGLDLHQSRSYFSHFARSLADKNLWYIFVWLFPLGSLRIQEFPKNWRIATGAACVAAFAMDAYYGGQPGTIGRALFTVAGPLLTGSVAVLLFTPGDEVVEVR
jgi:hypothetical protein